MKKLASSIWSKYSKMAVLPSFGSVLEQPRILVNRGLCAVYLFGLNTLDAL